MNNERPKPTSPSVLAKLLRAHDVRLSKRWGQNFLCDEHVVERIVAAVDPDRSALEIGPGAGALTLGLARRVPQLVAVEIDRRLVPLLSRQLAPFSNVQLCCEDILEYDLLQLQRSWGESFCVVGNLPYQITSPLLGKLVEARAALSQAVLMVQRELADKLLAPVGGGGGSSLGVMLHAFARIKRLFNVPKTVFFPRPQVDATVFELRFLERPRFQANETVFSNVVRAAFNLRRKTIRQALIQSPFTRFSPPQVEQLLKRAEVDPQRRGERLKIEAFDRIAQGATRLEASASAGSHVRCKPGG